MDFQNIILIVILLANLTFALLSYFKSRKTIFNLAWSIVIGIIVIWILSMIIYRTAGSETTVFWCRILYITATFMPVAFLYFSFLYPGGAWTISRTATILIAFSNIVIIFLLILPNIIIKDVIIRPGQEKEIIWGPGYFLYALYFSGYFIWTIRNLLKNYFKHYGILKSQIRYVLLGAVVSIILGSTFNLILPWFGDFRFNWLGQVTTLFMIGSISYAIIRYRFLDIRLVIGRGAVYALSFISVIALAFLLMFLGNQFFSAVPFNIIGPLILVISILLFQPIFRFFEKLASKYFYYTFYSYQTVLTNLGKRLTQVLELNKLSSSIVSTLMDTMKLDRTVILLREPGDRGYQIQKNIGFREENGISLVKDDFLTIWLEKTKEPLVYEELSLIIRDTLKRGDKRKLENLQSNMKRIEAALCLPLFIEEKIIGMIVLGDKVSGDPYSEQDIDLLTNLSNQASIALQNARLYSEVKGFSKKLEKEVEKRTKELKDAYEELKKLDKAKSEFVSIASHQLRTPLTAIKGYISMMREKLYGKPPEKMEKPLENIYLSNERLIKLVNDLLSVSRIEAGRMEMKLEKLSLEEMTASIVEELKGAVKAKNIYLKREKPQKPLPKISVDRDKIRQAITNVIDNAIRYTEKGGITIKTQIRDDKYRMQVSDTGVGLTKYETSKMFESFSRGAAGTRLYTEGVGLGLYIARRFIEMHNGKIWAESKGKNKGSTFYIELPLSH